MSCSSGPGQVAAISRFLDERNCYIMEFAQFEDELSGGFFVRALFRTRSDARVPLAQLRQDFPAVAADRFQMTWAIHDTQARPRVLIIVSKFDHCLDDILYRRRAGELKMEVTAGVSNHRDLEPLVGSYQVPFFYLLVAGG